MGRSNKKFKIVHKCITANTSAIWQHAALILTAKQKPYKKAYLLTKNIKEFPGKVQKNGPEGRKRSNRKSNRTRQKNKRGDSEVESNDSPEIPDSGETSDIPGLPSGDKTEAPHVYQRQKDKQLHEKRNILPLKRWTTISDNEN